MSVTIDIRTEQPTDVRYVQFAEAERDGWQIANRVDIAPSNSKFIYIEEESSNDLIRVHVDDIDNLIAALERAKELKK